MTAPFGASLAIFLSCPVSKRVVLFPVAGGRRGDGPGARGGVLELAVLAAARGRRRGLSTAGRAPLPPVCDRRTVGAPPYPRPPRAHSLFSEAGPCRSSTYWLRKGSDRSQLCAKLETDIGIEGEGLESLSGRVAAAPIAECVCMVASAALSGLSCTVGASVNADRTGYLPPGWAGPGTGSGPGVGAVPSPTVRRAKPTLHLTFSCHYP